MGLDMYFYARNKKAKNYLKDSETIEDFTDYMEKQELISRYGETKALDLIANKIVFVVDKDILYDVMRERYFSFYKEIGYLYKVNAIHNWLVNNIQNGVDDCGYYILTNEKIEELKNICLQVIESFDKSEFAMKEIKTDNGITYEFKKWLNTELAEKLLPTKKGFFWGSYEYDKHYYDDIKRSYEVLSKLYNYDPENMEVLYRASW